MFFKKFNKKNLNNSAFKVFLTLCKEKKAILRRCNYVHSAYIGWYESSKKYTGTAKIV
jgi:hypothetical protein